MKIGCDIVVINRFEKWTDSWVNRYFGDTIFSQYISRNKDKKYLASRWALKESVYKCTGMIENVPNDESGKPISQYCAVSSTHDMNICWAVAIAKN